MKFKEERPLANPEAAMAKLLEIANGLEADHAGRLSVGAINHAFLEARVATVPNTARRCIARLLMVGWRRIRQVPT